MKKSLLAILILGLACVSVGYAWKAVLNTAEAPQVLGITQADNLSAATTTMEESQTSSSYITIDGDNGTFYRYASSSYSTSTTSNYYAKWESTSTEPLVTLITSNGTTNNISNPNFSSSVYDATAGVVLYTGTSSFTYYLNISEGYEISGYSFDYYDYSSISPSMTIGDDSYSVPTSSESVSKTLDETTSQLTITLTGTKGYVVFHNFKVYFTQVAIDPTDKKIASVGDAVSTTDEFNPCDWYLFQVAGSDRKGYVQLKDGYYYNAGTGDATLAFTKDVPSLLFHVIDNGDDTFSFQDSEGNFLALNADYEVYCAQEGADYTTFTIGTIEEGVFYVQESTASTILDTNAPNNQIAGWGTDVPTSATGNNAHQFFPVTLTADFDEEISVPEGTYVSAGQAVEELEVGKWYFLHNAPNTSDREGWIYNEDGSGYYNASSAPDDNSKSASVANYLFRLAETSDGDYALIDGNNHFMGASIDTWSQSLYEAVVPAPGWTINQIDASSDAAAFSLLVTGTSYYLDTNGPGASTAVWAGTPTVDGNECVYFVEAEFVDLVDEATVQISTLTGTLTTNNSANYRYLWTSTDTNPLVTMTAYAGGTTTVANNMYKEAYDDEGTIIYYSSTQSAGSDYVIKVSEGYVITGYSFTYAGEGETETITIGDASYSVTTSEQESGTVEVSPAQTLTMNITGSNKATYLSDFYVYIEASEEVTLTYQIYFESTEGELIDTQTYTTYLYYDYPTISGDYFTISSQPSGSIGADDETTISLVATGSYPVDITQTANLSTTSSEATWYILYDRASTDYLLAYNGEGGFASRAGLDSYESLGNYLFAFVPVGFCQFKVYNAEGGYLVQGTSDGDYTTVTSDADQATTFTLGYNTNSSNDGTGFYLKVNDSSAYLNDYSGKGTLGVWASSWATSDAGSLIYAIEMTDEEAFNLVFGDELLEFYTTYGTAATTYLGKNYVGQARNLTSTMLAACAAYNEGTVSGMYDAFTADEINIDLDIIEFSTDQLYRIRNYQSILSEGTSANAGNGGYLTYSTDYTSSEMLQCFDAQLDDPKTVWQFIASEDESYEGYYIYLPNVEKYIGKTSSSGNSVQIEMVSDQSDAGIYNLNSQASLFQFNLGCLNSGSTSYSTYIRANGSSSKPVINYGSANQNSWLCWYLEEATELTSSLNEANDKSYATLYLPFAVEVNGEAYVMSVDEDLEAALTATSIGTTVPAGTPVLVVNDEGETDVTYEILSEATDEITATNVLSGTYVDLAISSTDGIYVFGNSSTYGLGFYTPNSSTLSANKAYYQSSDSASAIKINFGDNVETSISLSELTDASQTEGIYYDLSGRIVKKPAAGVYIVNGKKVILK